MAIQVFNVKDHYANHAAQTMKLLVAGEAGAGKTRMASTFPCPIYADAEGLLLSVRDRDVRAVRITTVKELEDLRAALDQRPEIRAKMLGGPVETVVLDTVDHIAQIMMDERKRSERKEAFTMPDWGIHGDRLRDLLRSFRNLDLNVIFNVHLKSVVDEETGRVEYRPAIQGSVGNEIPQFVDECFLLERRTTTDPATGEPIPVRFLRTYANSSYVWLKDHSGALPVEFPVDLNTDYERLAKAIFGATPPQVTGPSQRVMDSVAWEPARDLPDPDTQPERPIDPERVAEYAAQMAEGTAEATKPRKKAASRRRAPAMAPPADTDVVEPEAPVAPDAPPEPETHPDTAVPENGTATAPEAVPEDEGKPACAVCATTDINEDYIELSEARWGEVLCRTHFLERNKRK